MILSETNKNTLFYYILSFFIVSTSIKFLGRRLTYLIISHIIVHNGLIRVNHRDRMNLINVLRRSFLRMSLIFFFNKEKLWKINAIFALPVFGKIDYLCFFIVINILYYYSLKNNNY